MLRRHWQFVTKYARTWREKKQQSAALRTRAVEAVTLRRALEEMVTDNQKRIADLQAQADTALEQVDWRRAGQFLEERHRCEQAHAQTRELLAQAGQAVEQVKADLRREQQEIVQRYRASSSWTPALFPVGRNSPESVAHLVAFLLVGAILVGLIQWLCQWLCR